MTSTTYYNLNIVEGTDTVNPLIVDNPNYEKIDKEMHDNAVAGVTLANEIANATVHAITRENSDCAVIRFIATSQWKAGDTATVDGVPVTALLPSGETLPDGAYVINANVLCILTGTNLTFYLGKKKVENANEIPFNNTTVGAELVKLDEEVVRLGEEDVRLDNKIDNVSSNLTALNASLSWKVGNTSVGKNGANLPANYNELLIAFDDGTEYKRTFTVYLPKISFNNNTFYFYTSNTNARIENNKVYLDYFMFNNNNITDTARTTIYYR